MSNNTSSERVIENTEQIYAFGKPMANKYVFGVTNTIGAPFVYNPEQSQSGSCQAEGKRSNYALEENGVRVELEMNQRETVDAEARTAAILELQTSLMNKILEDTKESLREVYTKQIKEDVFAQYQDTAAAHKEEVRLQLVEQLTPEVKAMLRVELMDPVKEELRQELKAEYHHDEDLSFPGKQGKETDHIGDVEDEASPSAASQGVKRSHVEQEYDEDDFRGLSPKRARISGYGGEEDDEKESEDEDENEEEDEGKRNDEEENEDEEEGKGDDDEPGDRTAHVGEAQEKAPTSPNFRSVKRSRIEEESEEENNWERGPKRARISSSGEEQESGEDAGEGWKGGGFDTRGLSFEDPIDLDDSNDERYADDIPRVHLGMPGPSPASPRAGKCPAEGMEDHPDYLSGGGPGCGMGKR
ncbi:Translation initiation factor eIF-2B subunit epsilon [Lobaria immixta]|nr:Translation initiation factor eIF-2B subunit epsilon [Lobaria immixta]